MPLRVYNTLTRQKEEFTPLKPPKVGMYVCGITAYDDCHLGHARAYVTFDIIRRYLEYKKFKVTYIQNITDIDDKIINRAKELKKSPSEVAKKYIDEYFKDIDKLGVKRATNYPKATENILEMINLIKKLIDKGFAYAAGGDVFFSVRKFKDYGKLSHRRLEEMEAGARVEVDKRKKDPLDFVLWKAAKEGEPAWDSPWGKGRPGWHIECSVMSIQNLGETFDIHGGGRDLIFPHHENEIAQAEAATGKPLAKYWIHNGFVTVNKEKMSKSLGNFFTLKEIYQKYEPEVIRLYFFSKHYRNPLDFSDKDLDKAKSALSRLYGTLERVGAEIERRGGTPGFGVEMEEYGKNFEKAMDNDFNTAKALATIFDLQRFLNTVLKSGVIDIHQLCDGREMMKKLGSVLGILERSRKKELLPEEIKKLIDERGAARDRKDWHRADEIRKQLAAKGIILEDTSAGVRWRKI